MSPRFLAACAAQQEAIHQQDRQSAWDNRISTPVDLTQESLEAMLIRLQGIRSIAIRPQYLVSTFPLPPRRVKRFRLITEILAVELGIPQRSRRSASFPYAYSWVDKRALARYLRRRTAS